MTLQRRFKDVVGTFCVCWVCNIFLAFLTCNSEFINEGGGGGGGAEGSPLGKTSAFSEHAQPRFQPGVSHIPASSKMIATWKGTRWRSWLNSAS